MEEFIEKLKKYFDGDDSLKSECVSLANEFLFTTNGDCDWVNILLVRSLGFSVYPGDSDSFGWLIGVIENDEGKRIIYG